MDKWKILDIVGFGPPEQVKHHGKMWVCTMSKDTDGSPRPFSFVTVGGLMDQHGRS